MQHTTKYQSIAMGAKSKLRMQFVGDTRMQPIKVIKGIWHIPSFSSRRKLYHVRYSGIYGEWCCDCKSWIYRHHDGRTDCKHVRFVKEIIDTWPMSKLEMITCEH